MDFGELHLKYSSQDYHRRLIDLDIPLISDFLIYYSKLKLFHRIINELSPLKLPSYIVRNNRLRSKIDNPKYAISNSIIQPLVSAFHSGFFPTCIELWNSLSTSLKNTTFHNTFITNLKSYCYDRILDGLEPEPD